MKNTKDCGSTRQNYRRFFYLPSVIALIGMAALFLCQPSAKMQGNYGNFGGTLAADPQNSVTRIGAPQVTVQAAKSGTPFINLRDGQNLNTKYIGDSLFADAMRANQVQPLTLTSGDFDEDGMPDLVSGYGTSGGGGVTLQRGNVQVLWPYGKAIQDGTPPAFLPDASVISLPEAPDFLGAGDFNADGHWDIVAAKRGGNSLYFLPGDGHGEFGEAQRIELSGSVTALTTGEINRTDGLTDIVVGVVGESGARILVFESPNGALRDDPEILPLPSAATSLVLGQLDGDATNDLVVAAGHELLIVHGRDRKLTLDQPDRDEVEAAKVTQQSFPFSLTALAIGSFTGAKQDLAVLGDDDRLHFMERSDSAQETNSSFAATIQPASAGGNGDGTVGQRSAAVSMEQVTRANRGRNSPSSSARNSSMTNQQGKGEWRIREALALPFLSGLKSPRSLDQPAPQLVSTHVSISPHDDLIVVDAAENQLQIISDAAAIAENNTISANTRNGRARMSITATLDLATGAPAAVLPMRLNPDPLSDLVVLQSGKSEPTTVETVAAIFTVTNTSDSGPGSLRQAMIDAQAASGASSITFNIPNSDPNRDPATGVFTIKPIADPSGFTALPGVFKPVTIDGYTQPGASPNTLAGGDNAVLLIEINGANAGMGWSMQKRTASLTRHPCITILS